MNIFEKTGAAYKAARQAWATRPAVKQIGQKRTFGDILSRPRLAPGDAKILDEINRQMERISEGMQSAPHESKILEEMNRRSIRTYEAAITTNLSLDFPVSITSANAELLVSLMAGRSRARRLERDNPYCFAILQEFQKNVVGHDPFRLEMDVGKFVDGKGGTQKWEKESDTNRMIQDWWDDMSSPKYCTVGRDMARLEMDLLAVTAMVRDGGILFQDYPGFPNNDLRYAVEPIEVDRLDFYWIRPKAVDGANEIQFSIEFDQYHAPVAYHILTRHPGDVFAYTQSPRYRERVEAERITALWDVRTRAGQYVAMPRFSSIIQRLHRIDQFDIAHVTAAIWSSCKPFFYTQEFPSAIQHVPDHIKSMMGAVETVGQEGEKSLNLQPGSAEVLPWGMKLNQLESHFPIEASSKFKKENLQGASVGAGVWYPDVSGDLEGVNFSTARIMGGEVRAGYMILQEHMIERYRRPIFEKSLYWALMSGKLKLPMIRYAELCRAAHFYAKRWPYVQPLDEAQADIIKYQSGLTSRSEIIRNSPRGGDVETVDGELASDVSVDNAHDLDFTTADTTLPKLKKGVPGQIVPNSEGQSPSEQQSQPGNKNRLTEFTRNGHD